MRFEAVFHPRVVKEDIPALSEEAESRVRHAVEARLCVAPARYGKPLRYSLKSLWSLRVGDYRVIYRIEGTRVVILKIGHRRDVYRRTL